MSMLTPLYLEDLDPGARYETARIDVSEAEVIEFAQRFDPQPFHTDAAAAGSSLFGRLVASGWHTGAISMRLFVDGPFRLVGGLIGARVTDMSWPRPTEPGDTLRVVTEVLAVRPSQSRPDRGWVVVRNTTLNQRDEPVQIMTADLFCRRRPAE